MNIPIRFFPSSKAVFVNPEKANEYMLPQASFNLADFNSAWSGDIHFVSLIEPMGEGVIGRYTHQYHSYSCRGNWVGFNLINGKYDLDASYSFFEKDYKQGSSSASDPKRTEALEAHYGKVKQQYLNDLESYQKSQSKEYFWINKHNASMRLGDESTLSKWQQITDFPLEYKALDLDDYSLDCVYPLTEDGRRFHYLGRIWSTYMGCYIVLFYDPFKNQALQTFDYFLGYDDECRIEVSLNPDSSVEYTPELTIRYYPKYTIK